MPNFVDLTVNEQGIISAIDAANGIIYQYDDDRNLLTMFGGKGEENGKFGYPISIETDPEGNLYILDKDRNNIQVFRPTHFAQLVHAASEFYVDGHYAVAEGPGERRSSTTPTTTWRTAALRRLLNGSGVGKRRWWNTGTAKIATVTREIFAKLRHEWIRDTSA